MPCVIERVLRRSIDAGLISITAVFAHALNVPVIPVEDLCEFYLSDKVRYLRLGTVLFFMQPWGRASVGACFT